MSIADKIVSKDQEVLISIHRNQGRSIDDIARELERSTSSIRRTVTKLEEYGMVRGDWDNSNGRWKRKYYLSGEGTRDFIATLSDALE